jgi:hypothetical protein
MPAAPPLYITIPGDLTIKIPNFLVEIFYINSLVEKQSSLYPTKECLTPGALKRWGSGTLYCFASLNYFSFCFPK